MNEKYRQLAIFSVIVAEVVITPSALGGLAYWLLKENKLQFPATAFGAVVGLVIAFYRISLLNKKMDQRDQ